MSINPRFKGYILALIAALALSNVYIFSKAALNEVALPQFGFYWFGLGLLWNFFYTLRAGKINRIRLLNRRSRVVLIIIGLLEVAATLLFFIAIITIENPAIVAFIANMTPFFVAVLGILILRERFNTIEIVGMIFTFAGTVVISYKFDTSFSELLIPGTEYILISGFLYAIATIIAKSNIKNIDPSILSLNRVVYLFAFSLLSLIFQNESLAIPTTAFLKILIGSILGPFLTAVASYTALRYIEASKATLVRSSRNVFVLIGAYMYFSVFPNEYQLIGAAISVCGVIMITLGKTKISR